MDPFAYPNIQHARRHGPEGYSTYEAYRPWLRDEFLFRCVYCLRRERWDIIIRRAYDIDHFECQASSSDGALDYDNLLYACASCNSAKGAQRVDDPCQVFIHGDVEVKENGSIVAQNSRAKCLIQKLGLNDPDYIEYRRELIQRMRLYEMHAPQLYNDLMRFPDDMPDLGLLRPPENNRPNGVQESCYARRSRGELPATY